MIQISKWFVGFLRQRWGREDSGLAHLYIMFIHKQEEMTLSIGEDYIHKWWRDSENNIPDSGLAAMMEDQQKRGRSDINDAKRAKLTGIPEWIFITIVHYKRNPKIQYNLCHEIPCA
jgi:hypothetical protein